VKEKHHPIGKHCAVDINDWVQAAWKSAQDKIKNLELTIKREQMKIMKPVKFYDYKTQKYTSKWVEDATLYDSVERGSYRCITGTTDAITLALDHQRLSTDINDQMVTIFPLKKFLGASLRASDFE
jgi:hypothetical protein